MVSNKTLFMAYIDDKISYANNNRLNVSLELLHSVTDKFLSLRLGDPAAGLAKMYYAIEDSYMIGATFDPANLELIVKNYFKSMDEEDENSHIKMGNVSRPHESFPIEELHTKFNGISQFFKQEVIVNGLDHYIYYGSCYVNLDNIPKEKVYRDWETDRKSVV